MLENVGRFLLAERQQQYCRPLDASAFVAIAAVSFIHRYDFVSANASDSHP
jgi:hypothetical protein